LARGLNNYNAVITPEASQISTSGNIPGSPGDFINLNVTGVADMSVTLGDGRRAAVVGRLIAPTSTNGNMWTVQEIGSGTW
jgi:hypothetical protein